MNGVIPFQYQGQAVSFSSDGWINATEVAKRYGKRPAHWLELPSTKSYMNALRKHLDAAFDVGKSDFKLVESSRIRGKAGTWLHPKLAVAFARWLDVDFSVWCDLHIDALLRGRSDERRQLEKACKTLSDARDVASHGGRDLASFRWKKQGLEYEVEHWREQLELTLSLGSS